MAELTTKKVEADAQASWGWLRPLTTINLGLPTCRLGLRCIFFLNPSVPLKFQLSCQKRKKM